MPKHARGAQQEGVLIPTFLARFAETPLEEVTKAKLEQWLHDVEIERDLSKLTVKTWITSLNHFFDFLVEEGALIVSPRRRIRLPPDIKIPKRNPKSVLSPEELKRLLEQAKLLCSRYLYPLLLTYVHTGARRNEVLGLLWSDVDTTQGTITFRKTKNGSDRTIRIPPSLLETLKHFPRRSPYVFTTADGLPIKKWQLDWMVEKFRRTFPSDKHWCLHSFRHSFAHNFRRAGGQMYELQAILGHRDIHVTINQYGQLNAAEIENPSPYRF